MLKIITSIHKEFLILIRDKAGLAILFMMPIILITVMTLIQDSTYKKLDETQLKVLLLDMDGDSLGAGIEKGLASSGFLAVKTGPDHKILDRETINRLVSDGKYQIGIVVEPGATGSIRNKAKSVLEKAFLPESAGNNTTVAQSEKSKVVVFFDPVIKNSYKQSVLNALQNFIFMVEAKINFEYYAEAMAEQFGTESKPNFDPEGGIGIEEHYARTQFNEVIPNSVQHNVPAWAIFAMFFIIIPLTGNIIRERESGSILRIKLVPGSYLISAISKIAVYVIVCMIQFAMMLMVGKYILPFFGTPALSFGIHIPALIFMTISVALAATGYGVMVATLATTHDQAASFGSVSVIILAAIGGIWVPVFVMPVFMQKISVISPLNWGLDGFYTLFLRGGNFSEISLQAGLLLAFFAFTLFVAFQYQRMKRI